MRPEELRGLAADLRSAVPALVTLQKASVRFFGETRLLASCQNEVLLPFAKEPIHEPAFPDNTGEPFYKQSSRGLVGLAGESRIHDANTPIFRVQASGGPFSVQFGEIGGEDAFAQAPFPIEGVNPIKPFRRPEFRPDIACETQEPPNLASRPGEGEPSRRTPAAASTPKTAKQKRELDLLVEHMKLERKGIPSVDPYANRHEVSRRFEARRMGFKKNLKGLWSFRGIDSSGRKAE
jgi:hypothetical protein